MKTILFKKFSLLTFVLLSPLALANSFTGTVITAKGDVKVLTQALSDSSTTQKYVLYEGNKFSYKKAKIGMRLRPGQVVQTGTDGKAKVAYTNGDHLVIAPGTSVSLPEPVKGKKDTSKIQLFYGKMRNLISKQGPRTKLNVKTKSAVAGVRGTDFYVSYNGGTGTEVVVMRGAVALNNESPDQWATDLKDNKVSVVKTGFRANASETKKKQKIEIAEASKDKLLEVQAYSSITLDKKELESLPEKEQKEVMALEKKATKAILEDIKIEDPELYKSIDKSKTSTEDINTQVVAKLFKQAPRLKKKKKANLETIDQIGQDVYKKYFKTPKD